MTGIEGARERDRAAARLRNYCPTGARPSALGRPRRHGRPRRSALPEPLPVVQNTHPTTRRMASAPTLSFAPRGHRPTPFARIRLEIRSRWLRTRRNRARA
jgi:hypothetical protein